MLSKSILVFVTWGIIGTLVLTYQSGYSQNENYQYDSNGRLIADLSEGIVNIRWNNMNKITHVFRSDTCRTPDVEFAYDGMGNRITKIVKPRNGKELLNEHTWLYTHYIYGPTDGKLLAVYSRKFCLDSTSGRFYEKFSLIEEYLTESKNLGYQQVDRVLISQDLNTLRVTDEQIVFKNTNADLISINPSTQHGNKIYLIKNHLANVVTTISDRKLSIKKTDTLPAVSIAEVISAIDYYPFGMALPFRNFNSATLRYGFNGKELDSDIKGLGNSYNFDARIYDPRVSRFLSIDPLYHTYPSIEPYAFAANTPIQAIDFNGLKPALVHKTVSSSGLVTFTITLELKVRNSSHIDNETIKEYAAAIAGQTEKVFSGFINQQNRLIFKVKLLYGNDPIGADDVYLDFVDQLPPDKKLEEGHSIGGRAHLGGALDPKTFNGRIAVRADGESELVGLSGAHEIGHSLNLRHAEDDIKNGLVDNYNNNLMGKSINSNSPGTKVITPRQRSRVTSSVLRFSQKYIRRIAKREQAAGRAAAASSAATEKREHKKKEHDKNILEVTPVDGHPFTR